MKILVTLRHAKAEPHNNDDKSRALSERGIAQCHMLGQFCRKHSITIDRILCSAATRTRQTCELVLPYLSGTPHIIYDEALYHASPAIIMQRVRILADEADKALMVVGHNPGIHQFTADMLQSPADRTELLDFPTCSFAYMEAPQEDWPALGPRSTTLKHILFP